MRSGAYVAARRPGVCGGHVVHRRPGSNTAAPSVRNPAGTEAAGGSRRRPGRRSPPSATPATARRLRGPSEIYSQWHLCSSIRIQIRKSLSKKSCKAISSRYITSYMATWGQSQFAFFWERKRNIKLFCTHAKSLQVKNNKSLCYLSAPGRNNKLLDINGFKPPSY